jgi:hypothetical protein
MKISSVSIQSKSGSTLIVPLEQFEDREVGVVLIDGVPYHIERVSKDLLRKAYKVDFDRDYIPKTDSTNRCVIIAPFCQE